MIVEHVLLFKFKEGYTQEVEDNMFEDLWTFEDYFPTVMSMSMGKLAAKVSDEKQAVHYETAL